MAPERLDRRPELAWLPGFAPPPPRPRGGALRVAPHLLRAMGHFRVHPVTYGNRATLFTRGRDAFAAMLDAIEGARSSVNLETYIFQADGIGRRFAEALARKAAAGVVVNLTVDAVGCWGTPDAFFADLSARGVRVLVFNPVRFWRLRHARWSLNRRDHRKILVVDGRVGFTGGMNVGDEYDSDGVHPGRAKDTHVRLEGPAVRYLQRAFMAFRWREEEPGVAAGDWFPELEEKGDLAVRVLPTTPILGRPYVRIVLRRAIAAARRSIQATQAYFVPDLRVLWSLRGAARRGVEVDLVVPSVSDVPLALHAGRGSYGTLLRAGVRIHELQGQWLHQKSVVVDGEWSIVGSANMDIRSFRTNHEISLDVLGREFAERLEQAHAEDLSRSNTLERDAWAARPLRTKIFQRLCGLFEAYL